MHVKVMRLSEEARQVEVSEGATAAEAVVAAGFPRTGFAVQVNADNAGGWETVLQEGDIVTLVPKIEAGA